MSDAMTDEQFAKAAVALRRAIREVGGVTKLAELVGVSQQTVSAWNVCPAHHLGVVNDVSGVPMEELRPDILRGK